MIQTLGFCHKWLLPTRHRQAVLQRAEQVSTGAEPELELLAAAARDVVDGFVDIGAAGGLYLAWMTQLGLPCVGFEPDPWSAALLTRAFPSVKIHRVALADESGEAVLSVPRTAEGRRIAALGSIRRSATVGGDTRTYTVPVRRLDDYEVPAGRLAIKIDVEGAELSVLAGGEQTLKSVDVALIECEERHLPGGPDQLIDVMTKAGFTGHLVYRGELIPASEYRRELHQSDELVAMIDGAVPDPESQAIYGNNFLFTR